MKKAILFFALTLICVQLSLAQNPPSLKLGDPAPPVAVEKWLKGTPVDLKDGKVHVIELWATWCGPCKFGMPHLSNLAKKYRGEVEITGISILEEGDDYLLAVESFVRHANESMDYNAAAGGGKDAEMAASYLHAVSAGGIPYAFVIDREGRLAWHGHPLIGLDEAIELAVQDKLTVEAAERINRRIEERSELSGLWRSEFLDARRSGDDKTVLALADKIVDNFPHMGAMVIPYQYVALTNTDPVGAAEFGEKLLTEYYNAPMILTPAARIIVDEESRVAGERDYALAVRLVHQAEKMVRADAGLKELLARALFLNGDIAGAVTEQEKAIALAVESGADAEPLRLTLEQYRKALK